MENTLCAFCHQPSEHEPGCPGDLRDANAEDAARLRNALGIPSVPVESPSKKVVHEAFAGATSNGHSEKIEAEVDGAPAIILNGRTGAPLELIPPERVSSEESLARIACARQVVDECKEALVVPTAALRAAQKQLEEAVTAGVVSYWESRQLSLAEV